jgi:hypothetical protein
MSCTAVHTFAYATVLYPDRSATSSPIRQRQDSFTIKPTRKPNHLLYSPRPTDNLSTHRIHNKNIPLPPHCAHTTATMAPNMSLFSVNAILLLAADDNSRILTKYYSPPHPPTNMGNNYPGANPYPGLKDQKAFEKGLLEKTAKSTNDVILYDNRIVVYKTESDVMLYVVGPADENEIMLYNVVLALRDSLNILLK